MNHPMEKYRFIQNGNKVIAISTYAGKTVRGVAKCDPRDTMDLETGKKIAALRCAQKVAKRRLKRANKKLDEAYDMLKKATTRVADMQDYYGNAAKEFMSYKKELHELLGVDEEEVLQ